MRMQNNTRSRALRGNFASALTLAFRQWRRAGWFAIVAGLVAWPLTLAAAEADDPCTTLQNRLVTTGEAIDAYKRAKDVAEKNQAPAPDPIRFAVNELAKRPSPFHAELSTQRLTGRTAATLTFEDKRIAGIKDGDANKLCVRLYANARSARPLEVPVLQTFLSENADHVKHLNVVFSVEPAPADPLYDPVDYLFVGALTDATPPTYFNYFVTTTVMSGPTAELLAILFVVAFYGLLAWTTYDADAKSVTGVNGLAYALSPIRISAAWYGEASMSQVQVLLFTFIVAGRLFYLWICTGALSAISTDLLTLLGISAVGAAGAKFTQTLKTGLKEDTAAYLVGRGWFNWPVIPARYHATFGKLLLTDDRLDVYKFQMAIFTVVVAWYVLGSSQTSLGEVKISETMLYLIGISQGVYVGGKAVTDRTTDLENSVKKMTEVQTQISSLTRDIESNPPPANLGELQHQREARAQEYREAARMAVGEFAPLMHRQYPRNTDAQGHVILRQGVEDVHPDVLEPDYH